MSEIKDLNGMKKIVSQTSLHPNYCIDSSSEFLRNDIIS